MKTWRVEFLESERGWGQKYETMLYETEAEARKAYEACRPDGGSAPDYYYISLYIENFDTDTMEWKRV